ncbi:hypothetical protein LEP1GSC193_3487 [Leptospira alstonii serovar Pingchang str. 80-412]|uniref:Uncharacterized protein n=2 Tax=Leptospira alstonii TaxID=28452 RepID=M6CYE5_9LEPT|nr:hypothetical protein LEP1GSC194_2288 [Leptospira alstonii serovar Sichuan str. 79601]EQA82000.1 hypothetical protein LEP1GSC193_3487 [Leptospira alstonii serovar Pingchang str. 80-412]
MKKRVFQEFLKAPLYVLHPKFFESSTKRFFIPVESRLT